MKINKDFTVVISPTEVEEIVKDHIRNMNELLVTDVIFDMKPKTDDYGNYAGHEFVGIVCKGKLKD